MLRYNIPLIEFLNPYCTLDAREVRSDNLSVGQTVLFNMGYDESIFSEVVEIDWQARKVRLDLKPPMDVNTWVRMRKLEVWDTSKLAYKTSGWKLQWNLPTEARVKMLENKLGRRCAENRVLLSE